MKRPFKLIDRQVSGGCRVGVCWVGECGVSFRNQSFFSVNPNN